MAENRTPEPPRPVAPNATQSALDAGRLLALQAHDSKLPHGKPYVILKQADGSEAIEYLDGVFEDPLRAKHGVFTMFDLPSFLALWKDHNNPDSRVYAQLSPAKFEAVLDDHFVETANANWREHRIVYEPKFSPEWTTWTAMHKKVFANPTAFAEWLEDNMPDVTDPDGATLMEIVTTFNLSESIQFDNAVRLSNGQTQVKFHQEISGVAGQLGEFAIPEQFLLQIPVWEGPVAKRYNVEARFKYRPMRPGLKIWYELVRPHKIIERAFLDILADIEAVTGRPPLFGAAGA